MQQFRAVILGSGGVGKSTLTLRFIENKFVDIYDPTIEETFTKEINVDGQQVSLEVLDTAGAEQFTAINEFYLKGADGFILVYSLTSRQTLLELEPILRQIIEVKGLETSDIPIVVVGSKADLVDEREVLPRSAQQYAQKWKLPFRETSAKRNLGVNEAFNEITRQMIKRKERHDMKQQLKSRKSKRSLTDHHRTSSRPQDRNSKGQAVVYKKSRAKSCIIM